MGRKRSHWLVPVVAIAIVALGAAVLRFRERSASGPDPIVGRLRALGYVGYVRADPGPERTGVTRHDPARVWPGVNVYCSVRSAEISFVDMQGVTLHRLFAPDKGSGDCLLEPYDGHTFLALNPPHLTRLDWNSSVQWVSNGGHHHDVAVGKNGEIYTLSEQRAFIHHGSRLFPVLDHSLTMLSPSGRILLTIPLLPLLRDRVSEERLDRVAEILRMQGSESPEYQRESDVLHPNTVELLERDLAVAPAGSVLLCFRELDLVAILDLEARKVLWSWGPGELDSPHQPTALDGGTLLIFDNGRRRGTSRVIEFDPATERIVWEYRGDPPESFFSDIRGGAEALPNGNVLITESAMGRVFEVTREGDVVWEFWNPEHGPQGERKQIYRMFRISTQEFAAFAQP